MSEPRCFDCGERHETGAEALACDHKRGHWRTLPELRLPGGHYRGCPLCEEGREDTMAELDIEAVKRLWPGWGSAIEYRPAIIAALEDRERLRKLISEASDQDCPYLGCLGCRWLRATLEGRDG